MSEVLKQYSTTIKEVTKPYHDDTKYDENKVNDYEQVKDIQGVNKSDAKFYNIKIVSPNSLIMAKQWDELREAIKTEKERRNKRIRFYSKEKSKYLNFNFDSLLQKVGDIITASEYNKIVNILNAMGKECVCNCNYCTCNCNYCECNCNYCTCNCNYSCTCNCNY